MIVLALGAGILLLSGVLLAAYVELSRYLVDQRATRLRAQAKPVIDRRLEHLAGQVAPAELAAILAMDLTNRDTTAVLVDRSGTALGLPSPPPDPPVPQLPAEDYRRCFDGDPHVTAVIRTAGDRRDLLVVLVRPRGWRTHPPAVVQLVTEIGPEQRIVRRLVRGAAVGLGVAIAVGVVAAPLLGPAGESLVLLALGGLVLAGWLLTRRQLERPAIPRIAEGPPLPVGAAVARADFTAVMRTVEAAFLAQQATEQRMRRFLADASHELRTPLTAVGGAADLLLRHPEGDDVVALAAMVRRQADRMTRLVAALLVLARHDSGVPVQQVPVPLDRLIEHVADDLRLSAPDREILTWTPGSPTALGDPEQIHMMLDNLTSNAVRHGQPDGCIRLGAVNAGDGCVELTVTDDGDGVAPADAERIFERFFRKGDEGSGLGLAIVREASSAMGGTVAVSGEPGSGTTFTVRLPATRVPAPAPAPAPH